MDITKEEIKNLIGVDHPVILDIGSYDGKDAYELSELFNGCEIHCFEADPRIQEVWKDNNWMNTDLTLYHTALGSFDAPTYFNQSESKGRKNNNASGSLYQAKNHLELFPDVKFEKKCKVMCFRLDTWAAEVLKGKTVDFVWCDVNGAEKEVILGGLETLKTVHYLYIEFSDKELYEGQLTKEELLKLLPDFSEVAIYNYEGNFGNILLKNDNYNTGN